MDGEEAVDSKAALIVKEMAHEFDRRGKYQQDYQ